MRTAPQEIQLSIKMTQKKIRKNRLASLKNISDEDLAKLAEELEINPADCIDSADMLKKVRAALSKK